MGIGSCFVVSEISRCMCFMISNGVLAIDFFVFEILKCLCFLVYECYYEKRLLFEIQKSFDELWIYHAQFGLNFEG